MKMWQSCRSGGGGGEINKRKQKTRNRQPVIIHAIVTIAITSSSSHKHNLKLKIKQKIATKMVPELKDLTYEERLKEMQISTLEERKERRLDYNI